MAQNKAKAKATLGISRLFDGAARDLQPGKRSTMTAREGRTTSALALDMPPTAPLMDAIEAAAPTDDDTVPIEPGAVSKALTNELERRGLAELVGLLCFMKVRTREALAFVGDLHWRNIYSTSQTAQTAPRLMAELRTLRRELAQKAIEAADAASKSERGDAVERGILTMSAKIARKWAVETLIRDNAARERLAEAYNKLHEFTSRNVEAPFAAARASAAAYDEVLAALHDCPEEEKEFVLDACVPVRDAVVLSCLCLSGYRSRDAFAAALQDAYGRPLSDKVESQMYNAYSHLMEKVPGAFTSRSKLRTRNPRQRMGRAAEAEPEPEQADGEAPYASTVSTAASSSAPAVQVPPLQPAYINPVMSPFFRAEDCNGGYAPEEWIHAEFYGYQDFRSGSAVFAHEDFAQVEPNQAAKDPLNGAMIRRFFGDRWYGGQVMKIHEKQSTGELWYEVRYQDGTFEVLQGYIVQQGVQDLHGPSPPHADPGSLEQHYYTERADNIRIPMPCFVGKQDFHPGSDLQEYLATALKEALRLRSGLQPLVVTGDAASTTEHAFESDSNGHDDQRWHQRLSAIIDTLNMEQVKLKSFKTDLWLGSARTVEFSV